MKKTNIFKVAALTAVFAVAGMFANAQVTSGPDIPLQSAVTQGQDSGYVKVIDNKGTVKFLQSRNGITMFTNTAPSGGIVTTWQLGGTLSDDTYIDATGKQFGIKGLDTVGVGTYQMIVVDPTNGQFRRLDFSGLIQKGHTIYPVAANAITGTTNITVSGPVLPTFATVYVYRNGAKLVATEDYTITADHTVTVNNVNVPFYIGDKIEIHFIK